MVESSNEDDGVNYTIKSLQWLKGKVIRKIIHARANEFFFVCCKHYDQDLDIQSSLDEKWKMSIKRRISPGSIKVFDVALLDEFLVGLYTKI